MAGRVNASARKTTSGCFLLTLAISHSQNHTGLVCGLSTRKILTPWLTQRRTMRRISLDRPAGSLSKLSGKMSWYFFGGFSA